MGEVVPISKVDFLEFGECVELTPNSLRIKESTADDALARIAEQLKLMEGAINWYIGDFLCHVGKVRGSARAKLFLENWGMSESRASQAAKICSQFKPEHRKSELYFGHYEVVDAECDTEGEQLAWLDIAAVRGYSTAQLRAEIRRSLRIESKASKMPKTQEFHAIAASIKYAATHTPESLSETDREILKEDAPRMAEWWRQLAES